MHNNWSNDKGAVCQSLLGKFTRYVGVDTQSKEKSTSMPTTEGQLELGKILAGELMSFDVDVEIEKGYVYGHKAGAGKPIGLVAHLDTSPDASGKDVKLIVHDYEGGDLVLPHTTVPSDDLTDMVGQKVITSQGDTLLGGDDKAGIAIIMSLVESLVGVSHRDLYVMFTVDEELGRGVKGFNPDNFPVSLAYTIDGLNEYEVKTDTFNAAKYTIYCEGVSTHLGYAKDKLVSAVSVLDYFCDQLPENERPETTCGDEGYFCVYNKEAFVDVGMMEVYVRDFTKEGFEGRKEVLDCLIEDTQNKYGIELDVEKKDEYYNMRTGLSDESLQLVHDSADKCGIELKEASVRGGTDGARLTLEYGIPCPNLPTGVVNMHSVREACSLDTMYDMYRLVQEMVRIE